MDEFTNIMQAKVRDFVKSGPADEVVVGMVQAYIQHFTYRW